MGDQIFFRNTTDKLQDFFSKHQWYISGLSVPPKKTTKTWISGLLGRVGTLIFTSVSHHLVIHSRVMKAGRRGDFLMHRSSYGCMPFLMPQQSCGGFRWFETKKNILWPDAVPSFLKPSDQRQSWKTPFELGVSKSMECVIFFPSALWHCWLGDRKGIRPVKKTGCWFVGGDDLTGALHDL